MSTLAITSDATGVLLHGSTKGDGVAALVKPLAWRWSGRLGAWYRPRNLRPLTATQLEALADKLRAVGHDVTVEREDVTPAEREAATLERRAERADALDTRAEQRGREAAATYAAAREKASVIPFGQPILVDHYSAGRDRRFRDSITRGYEKAFQASDEARDIARRAAASRSSETHRMSAPTTMRRVEKLQAELRAAQRELTPCPSSGIRLKPEAVGSKVTCPRCYDTVTVGSDLVFPAHRVATGRYRTAVEERIEQLTADIEFWQQHLQQLQSAGVKVWTQAEVKAAMPAEVFDGREWRKVLRASAKSVTVPTEYSWTDRLGYDRLRGLRSVAG